MGCSVYGPAAQGKEGFDERLVRVWLEPLNCVTVALAARGGEKQHLAGLVIWELKCALEGINGAHGLSSKYQCDELCHGKGQSTT